MHCNLREPHQLKVHAAHQRAQILCPGSSQGQHCQVSQVRRDAQCGGFAHEEPPLPFVGEVKKSTSGMGLIF